MTDSNQRSAVHEERPGPPWKTITTQDEHEDFPGQLLVTRDQQAIMEWARQRDATPVTVHQHTSGDRLDELRLDVPGSSHGNDDVTPVPWDDWLHTFMVADLRFVYQEHSPEGDVSTYYRLDTTAHQEGGARPT